MTPGTLISERPAEAADRAVPGHWESDLLIGLDRSAIGTVVDRTTRFTMLVHLPREEGYRHKATPKNGPALAGYGALTMKNALANTMSTLPAQLTMSLTWDRGKEMSAHGTSTPERVNRRNGHRHRDFDTRAGTLDVAISKLRQGSYFPEWLLERRKRAERALTSVVATCYLLGVSTRRMDKLVASLGITSLSKPQVPEMAKELDADVEEFRTRSLADAGLFTFVAAHALVLKVREGGCVVPVHALVATGVNADGHREILGVQVTTSEDGAGWLAFFRDLTARGLRGVRLVTSDAHRGLTAAIAATMAGASWQRCRTHYAANLMSATPKSSWGWGKPLLHSIYD